MIGMAQHVIDGANGTGGRGGIGYRENGSGIVTDGRQNLVGRGKGGLEGASGGVDGGAGAIGGEELL